MPFPGLTGRELRNETFPASPEKNVEKTVSIHYNA